MSPSVRAHADRPSRVPPGPAAPIPERAEPIPAHAGAQALRASLRAAFRPRGDGDRPAEDAAPDGGVAGPMIPAGAVASR